MKLSDDSINHATTIRINNNLILISIILFYKNNSNNINWNLDKFNILEFDFFL